SRRNPAGDRGQFPDRDRRRFDCGDRRTAGAGERLADSTDEPQAGWGHDGRYGVPERAEAAGSGEARIGAAGPIAGDCPEQGPKRQRRSLSAAPLIYATATPLGAAPAAASLGAATL